MSLRFNTFGSYVKKTFGTLVQKVNIDAGFTCPNRDGTISEGGCVFCNNDSFKPGECRPALSVTQQIQNGITYLRRRYGAEKFIAYFQAYTNTYAPVDDLERIYREALAEPSVIGIAVGTRPDCIDAGKLDLLASIAKEKFVLVEYGLQSIHEKSLRYINRGHDYNTFLKAVSDTHARGLKTGVHTIVGIPTETREETLAIADELSITPVEFVKIHQLQVIKETPLATTFNNEPFHVFEYEEYLDFVVEFIEHLRPDMVLQRLFATAPDEILIAPQWGRTRHEILRDIERRFEKLNTWQGRRLRRYTNVH